MIKVHIAIAQFEYIEIEAENIQEAIDRYFEVKDLFEKKLKDRKDNIPPFDSENPPRNPHLECEPNQETLLVKEKK